jgi:hypothetical protein
VERWSERNMHLVGAAALEGDKGNPSNTNSFSALGNDIIMQSSSDMGVVINNIDLPLINLITELEKARQSLNERTKDMTKQQEEADNNIVLPIDGDSEMEDICSDSDHNNEESSSESNGFALVLPRREREREREGERERERDKPNRLSLSGRKGKNTNK